MKCLFCNAPETKVIDSRLLMESTTIRRRRKCDACNKRFTTYEKSQIQMPIVVKSDGRRQSYDRDKILKGIKKACRKRNVQEEVLIGHLEDLEKHVLESYDKEVTSTIIGSKVMEILQKVDPVAYIRFASIYWDFQNINDFIYALQGDLKGSTINE